MNHRRIAILLCLLGMSPDPAWARQVQHERMKWEDLGSRLAKRKIAFALPDGTAVEGKVIEVKEDGLRLRVSRSSNRKVQPKGKQLISRGSISIFRLTEYRMAGRFIITTAAVASSAAIMAAKYPEVYEGPAVIVTPVLIAAGIIGVGIAAYFAGKAVDRRVIEITVEPRLP